MVSLETKIPFKKLLQWLNTVDKKGEVTFILGGNYESRVDVMLFLSKTITSRSVQFRGDINYFSQTISKQGDGVYYCLSVNSSGNHVPFQSYRY